MFTRPRILIRFLVPSAWSGSIFHLQLFHHFGLTLICDSSEVDLMGKTLGTVLQVRTGSIYQLTLTYLITEPHLEFGNR